MLELKNISISLWQNDRQLLENFNFTLHRGDKAVIIGEEGNGKSTLLKLIYDPDLIADYCRHSGSVCAKGTPGYLPQMIDERYTDWTVARFFAGLAVDHYTDILTALALPPATVKSEQIIKTLSGGEKVKIQLARVLMQQPDFLLLDEPTNDIDIPTLQWLEKFISKTRLPVLYVSHDETLIENTANLIIHIEQLGRKTKPRVTVARAGYRDYVAARSAAFDKQLQIARKQRSDYEAQLAKWQQICSRVEHEQETISRADPSGGRLLKKKMKAVKSQGRRLERQAEDFLEIPRTEEVILTRFSDAVYIPKAKVVLDLSLERLQVAGRILAENISLYLTGNEHIGIVGSNGAGKSTLLAVIWEQLRERRDIKAAFMPQDYAAGLDYQQSPVQYLAANYRKDDITKARTYMGSMRFTHEEMTGRIGALSGGQKAKILFLDMVLQEANVLVLDEPTRNFSPLSNPVIRKTLADFGGAIISVSHDRKYLDEVCTRVYELTRTGLVLQ